MKRLKVAGIFIGIALLWALVLATGFAILESLDDGPAFEPSAWRN